MVEQETTPHCTKRSQALARWDLLYEHASFSPIGSLVLSLLLLPFLLVRYTTLALAPQLTRRLQNRLVAAVVPPSCTEFASPFEATEAAAKLAQASGTDCLRMASRMPSACS